MWFTCNVPPLSCYWKFKLPHCFWLRFLLHIHTTYRTVRNLPRVVAFTANLIMTTSFQRFSHKGVWVNVTMNRVVFISGSEYRSEPKSQSVNAKWASYTFASWNHHKNPLNTSQVSKRNNTSGVDRPIGNLHKKIAKLQKSTLNGHESKRAKQMTMAIILVVVTKAMLEKIPNIANKQNTTTTTKREK